MSKKLAFVYLILHGSFLFAQQVKETNSICFFQDAKTGKPITIVNDALLYKGELKNPILLKHTEYPETLERYSYHFNIKNRSYLVNDGCGVVLEYRNDSIVRIDNSMLHKNQYNATPFIYNNEMYLFGGYGLFTFKNIITKYNFDTKEWNELISQSDEIPVPTWYSKRILVGDKLYLFRGEYSTKKTNPISVIKDDALWVYNLKDNTYKKLGICYKNLTEKFEQFDNFQANNKLYFILEELICEIDILNNTLKYYKKNSKIKPLYYFYDNKSDVVFMLNPKAATDELTLKSIKLSSLLNRKPFKTEPFYASSVYVAFWNSYKVHIVFGVLLVLIPLGFRNIYRKRSLNYIVYNQKKKQLNYKSNINLNLNELEEKLLIHLIKNNATYIQLNTLNNYFENENQENFNLIVKKRDLLLNSLFYKLQSVLQIEQEVMVLQQKNKTDKRIKEIRLNPEFFKMK